MGFGDALGVTNGLRQIFFSIKMGGAIYPLSHGLYSQMSVRPCCDCAVRLLEISTRLSQGCVQRERLQRQICIGWVRDLGSKRLHALLGLVSTIQGDPFGRSQPPVDIKTKAAFF